MSLLLFFPALTRPSDRIEIVTREKKGRCLRRSAGASPEAGEFTLQPEQSRGETHI